MYVKTSTTKETSYNKESREILRIYMIFKISKSLWDLHIFQHDSSLSLLLDMTLHASDVVKSGPDMKKKKNDEHIAGRTDTNHHDDYT